MEALPTVRGLPTMRRCRVMGILNVTPDSFSDGGRWLDPDVAIARGHQLAADGADLVDVGGESTRPGAHRVPVEEELRRVLPVVRELAAAGITVSIDTMRSTVAESALDAGASIVNDVSGGLADPSMLPMVALAQVPYVIMHWRGQSERMDELTTYADVIADVRSELSQRLDAAVDAGVDGGAVIVDPGLGFAKNADHNWTLLAHLDSLRQLGRPLLVGASRKRFLGALLADAATGEPRSMEHRDAATAAVTALAAAAGVWGVRVHEVPPNLDAVCVAAAWRSACRTSADQ
jgi:dihydropteroate synthase